MLNKSLVSNYVIYTLDKITDAQEWYTVYINGNKTKYKINKKGEVYNIRNKKLVKRQTQVKANTTRYVHQLSHEGKVITLMTARLVACVFTTVPKKYRLMGLNQEHLNVIQKDGNIDNFDLDNLEWLLPSENPLNVSNPKTTGTNCHLSKLTEEDVHQICKYLSEHKSFREIEELVPNATKSMINGIKRRTSWKATSKNYTW